MHIIFNNIEIEGFMSIGHINLDLKDSGYTLINGINYTQTDLAKSNGSGKSSIWEALVWCLTGETIRGTKNIENIIQNNGTCVKLNFNVNNDNFVLIRSKNHTEYKTGLLIYVNDKNVSGKGIRDSNKILNQYLPDLDNSIISSVIVLGQGLPYRFTNNTPAGRKEVLEQLSKSNFMIEDIKDRISKRKTELDTQLRSLQDQHLKLNSEYNLTCTQLDCDTSQLNDLQNIEDICVQVQQYENDIKNFDNVVFCCKDQLNEIKDKININNLKIQECTTQKNEQINAIQQKYNTDLNELNIELISVTKDITSLQKEIQDVKNIKDMCPTCGQKIPNVFKPDITEKQQNLDLLINSRSLIEIKLKEKNEELNNEINSVTNTTIGQINNLQHLNDVLQNKYLEIKNKLDVTVQDVMSIQQQIEQHKKTINSYETTKQLLQDRIKKARSLINEYQQNIHNNEYKIEDLQTHIDTIKKFDTIIKRDFRGYLLYNVIEYINTIARMYCEQVFNTQLIEFKLDGNNISISYNNKEYEMLSGGEKQKIDLIIQFSIRDMLCRYLDFSCNILVLDEIFDNLDAIGCEKVIELISNNLQEVSSVYIISHHAEELNIPADNYLTVIKDTNGVSYVK